MAKHSNHESELALKEGAHKAMKAPESKALPGDILHDRPTIEVDVDADVHGVGGLRELLCQYPAFESDDLIQVLSSGKGTHGGVQMDSAQRPGEYIRRELAFSAFWYRPFFDLKNWAADK